MFGAFGNQVYNAPTMKSFGGIYASEAYSQFHAPQKVVFEANPVFKPIDNIVSRSGDDLLKAGKWTDEGANVFGGIIAGFSKGDTKVLAGRLIGDAGALPPALEDLSKSALDAAITARLIGKSGDDITTTLSKMIEDTATDAGRLEASIAKKFAKRLQKIPTKTGNLGDDLLLDPVLRKGLGLKSLTPLVDDATSVGVKLSDSALGDEVAQTIINVNTTSGAREGGKAIGGLSSRMVGGAKVAWGLATPAFMIGVWLGGPDFIKWTLGLINITGAWDDWAFGDDDSGIPQCPNVGETCNSSTVLAEGCYCEDDDGDGEGTIKQQKATINYEGWAFFGALAVGGIVTIGLINSLLFPQR